MSFSGQFSLIKVKKKKVFLKSGDKSNPETDRNKILTDKTSLFFLLFFIFCNVLEIFDVF